MGYKLNSSLRDTKVLLLSSPAHGTTKHLSLLFGNINQIWELMTN